MGRTVLKIPEWRVRCAQQLVESPEFKTHELSLRTIAKELGIARGTLERLREMGFTTPPPDPDEEDEDDEELLEFLPTLTYWCPECERWVSVRPCVACAARAARELN